VSANIKAVHTGSAVGINTRAAQGLCLQREVNKEARRSVSSDREIKRIQGPGVVNNPIHMNSDARQASAVKSCWRGYCRGESLMKLVKQQGVWASGFRNFL